MTDVFERVIGRGEAQRILDGTPVREPLTGAEIEFVLVLVRGGTPDEISCALDTVTKIAIAHKATLYSPIGTLIAMTFGTRKGEPVSRTARIALVEDLSARLGSSAKVVHGSAAGSYGLFGGDAMMTYGFAVPGFEDAVGRLVRLQYGRAEECRP